MKEGKFNAEFEGKSYKIDYDFETIEESNIYSIFLYDAPLIKITGNHFHFISPDQPGGKMKWGNQTNSPAEQELKSLIALALGEHIKNLVSRPLLAK